MPVLHFLVGHAVELLRQRPQRFDQQTYRACVDRKLALVGLEQRSLHGDDVAVEQAAKQLYRLIDVLKVQDVTSESTIGQELALVKIRATESTRGEVLKLVELSKGRVLDVADESVVAEVTGPEADIDTFVGLVRSYGIKELVRTGAVVMARGSGSIEEAVKR